MDEFEVLLRKTIVATLKHRDVIRFVNAWNSNPILRIRSVEIIPNYTAENLYVDFCFNYQTVDKSESQNVMVSVAWNNERGCQVLKGECNS